MGGPLTHTHQYSQLQYQATSLACLCTHGMHVACASASVCIHKWVHVHAPSVPRYGTSPKQKSLNSKWIPKQQPKESTVWYILVVCEWTFDDVHLQLSDVTRFGYT